jgi:diacylglycerol kinase (ATP)
MENDEGDLRRRIGDDVVESNVHIVNNEDDNDNDGEIKVDKIIPIVVEEEEENVNNSNTNSKDANTNNNNNNTNNDNTWQINILPSNNEDQLPHLNEYNTRIRDILIIFVNPISGNQEGKTFLNIASPFTTQHTPPYKIIDYSKLTPPSSSSPPYAPIIAFLFNLIDKTEFASCISTIKHFIPHAYTSNTPLKVLIAGGDGTVLSLIETLNTSNININHLIFGHIPLGTGNDLSNALGFNNHITVTETPYSLYTTLLKYHSAVHSKVDVWKMELSLTSPDGDIIEIKNKSKTSKQDNIHIDNETHMKTYTRIFINYLSLGYDARVGYNFDKNRSDSRSHNKCIYFWEGLKKNFCRRTAPVSSFLESFTVLEDENESINEGTFLSHNNNNNIDSTRPQQQEVYAPKVKFCFKPKKSLNDIEKNSKCVIMKGEPASIICQNINMYMAGVVDIWKESKERTNLEVINTQHQKEYKYKLKQMSSGEQRLDDHQLEFFTYSNGLVTGMERMIRGLADKLYHGRGPIIMKFKQIINDDNDRYNRIYLNVDGEYFQLVKPVQMRIQLARELCNGSVPFLKRNK